MPTVPFGPRYNRGFISALIKAHVLGKESMNYKGNRYVIKDHIEDAARDIEDGWYSVEAKPKRY